MEVVETDLEDVVKFVTERILADEFDCLEGLQAWFADLNLKNWEDFEEFKKDTYHRIPLHADALFDLLLICWKPNQGSAFHPHPEHGCLVKVLRGSLTEEFKEDNGDISINEYVAGDTVYICDAMGTHRVQNSSKEPVISLHLYAPGDYTP
ncbi:MAG: hypothetical protein ACI9FN_000604 [Saprospiraceae bacterium]|jgi:hypothetical protein